MWLNRSTLLALVMLFATSSIASATPPTARAQHLNATATAYCDRGVTKDGTPVHEGIIAADPRVLPLGSIVHVHVPELAISGIFTVRDTGSAVKGRIVDIFMWSCRRAKWFGRRDAIVRVLTRGAPPSTSLAARD
jgi:3D (Asp-Asp-Asp) domain-containing protein